MKLIFEKDEESQISVFLNVDGSRQDFSYVDMIKALIQSKKMEDPVISKGFSEAEIKSVNSMVKFINNALSETEELDAEENAETDDLPF